MNEKNSYIYLFINILQVKGFIEQHSSYATAIAAAYPNIGLLPFMFNFLPRMIFFIFTFTFENKQKIPIKSNFVYLGAHWENQSNTKLFFDEFASSKGFDPLDPAKWYTIYGSDIENFHQV